MKLSKTVHQQLVTRFQDCFDQLIKVLKEKGTIDSTMTIARNKEDTFQVNLVITKDEDDMLKNDHGEVVL